MLLGVAGSGPVQLEGFLERLERSGRVEFAHVEGQGRSRDALGPGSAAASEGPELNNFVHGRIAGSHIE